MKYGFVYIWYDCKHKRYYIGAHWGTEDDGYICSSPWMKQAYAKRPCDFKRRIISRVYTCKKDMFDEEARWHSFIRDDELKIRYYNIKRHGDRHWSTDPDKALTVSEKISKANKGRVAPNKGKKVSDITKAKLREANAKQFSDEGQRELRRAKALEQWATPEYRKQQVAAKRGLKQSDDTIRKRKETWNRTGFKPSDVGFKDGHTPWNKGKLNPQLSQSRWWNDGRINKRCISCPGPTFYLGRIKNGS